jgi:hypothetical protein
VAAAKSTRSAAAGEPAATSKAIQDLGHSSVAATDPYSAHLLKEDLVAASQQVKIPVARRGSGNVLRMPR